MCPFSQWFSFHASRSSIICLDQETVRSQYFVIHLPNDFLASNQKQLSHVTEIIPKFSYYQQSNLRETQLPNNVPLEMTWKKEIDYFLMTNWTQTVIAVITRVTTVGHLKSYAVSIISIQIDKIMQSSMCQEASCFGIL